MSEKKKLGMKREVYEEALDTIRLKRAAGQKLTRREELLWAYKDVGRCNCGTRR